MLARANRVVKPSDFRAIVRRGRRTATAGTLIYRVERDPADPARFGIQTAMLRAAEAAPLAWLRFEADGRSPGGGLLLTLFPSGEHHVLARGDYHGRWFEWLGGNLS